MDLQTFNVIGAGSVSREKISLRFVAFLNDGHKIPMNIQSDEQSDVPAGQMSEFLFGMSVNPTNETMSFHEIKSFDDIDLAKLPVIIKHMGLVAGAVREFVRVTPKA